MAINGNPLPANQLFKLLPRSVTQQYIEGALNVAAEEGLVEVASSDEMYGAGFISLGPQQDAEFFDSMFEVGKPPNRFRLTTKGLVVGQREGRDLFEERRNYERRTGPWIVRDEDSETDQDQGTLLSGLEIDATAELAPPSEESPQVDWEPLPIDRALPTYSEMIEQLDAAKEAIRMDNGYSDTFPDERDEIVEDLSIGIENLKTRDSVTRNLIVTKLLRPLSRVIEVFNKAAIGEFAKLAVAAVKAYFFGA